jgi:hypothetical protein
MESIAQMPLTVYRCSRCGDNCSDLSAVEHVKNHHPSWNTNMHRVRDGSWVALTDPTILLERREVLAPGTDAHVALRVLEAGV